MWRKSRQLKSFMLKIFESNKWKFLDIFFHFFWIIEGKMKTANTIGKNIQEARKQKGYTQKQVAEKMFMTQQQYSRFENGIFELNYDQILFLCDLYDITPNDVFQK